MGNIVEKMPAFFAADTHGWAESERPLHHDQAGEDTDAPHSRAHDRRRGVRSRSFEVQECAAWPAPFNDPERTSDGRQRARVGLRALETLWFNTGTLCNIECAHCYIESSPHNDSLVYLIPADVCQFLDEIRALGHPTREIGFTGGEPFMNPNMTAMAELCLDRGFEVLILTNAMQPMQRPRIKEALLALKLRHGRRFRLRISVDYFNRNLHDEERGSGSFDSMVQGLTWLAVNGFAISVAGRTRWGEDERRLRQGYADLFRTLNVPLNADNPHEVVLFPEMDEAVPVPEITTSCWDLLHITPDSMMCAASRMVAKRKGTMRATVLPCTLLPAGPAFEMGITLADAARADGDNFEKGAVKLNHPHCARFCVLGGGSCSR